MGTHTDAEVLRLRHALEVHGVLTRKHLCEYAGAAHWPHDTFRQALNRAVRQGHVKPLGEDLFEVGPAPAPSPHTAPPAA